MIWIVQPEPSYYLGVFLWASVMVGSILGGHHIGVRLGNVLLGWLT